MPEELVDALRQVRERHVRDWLDTAIPALGGLTPREASRVARSRTGLESILKDMQQSKDRLPEDQRIDVRWLREELGFS